MNSTQARELLSQFGAAPIKLPSNFHEVAKLRTETKRLATELNEKTIAEKRDLTAEEKLQFDSYMATLEACSGKLTKTEFSGGLSYDENARKFSGPLGGLNLGGGRYQGPTIVKPEENIEGLGAVHDWMRTGIFASDSPLHITSAPVSSGLAAAIPTSVLDSLRSYFVNDPFRLAGSTIYNTGDTQPLVKPIISASADADTFTEGSSATESKPFQTDAFTFGGVKYSKLVKVSEEALMNVAMDLPSEIINELAASVANTFTKAITSSLVTALQGNPATLVSFGADHYEAILNLIAAVPPRFEDPSNCFMGSRAMLKLIRNTRATDSGVPLFNPTDGTVMNRRYIINDGLTRLVYGNWAAGAFVRKTPFILQRLLELFSSEGAVGFKATQFLDSKFLASVSAVTVQPLYFTHLDTEGS